MPIRPPPSAGPARWFWATLIQNAVSERGRRDARGRGLLLGGDGPDPVRRPRLGGSARVQGLRAGPHRPRQADGRPPPDRRLPLAFVRLGRPRHVRDRDARPALARRVGGRRWPAARQKMAVAFEFIEKLGTPLLLLPRPRRRAGGRVLRRVPRQPRRADRRRAGLPGADRRPAAVGHGQPLHPSALPGRRGHEPRSRGLRLRRGPGQAHARGHAAPRRRRTTSCGAAARATTRCSTPTSSARATSWPASCTSWPSTSTASASRARC